MEDLLARLKWSIIVIIIAPIPTLIYLAVRFLLSPEGYWQEIILLGIGVWVLGFIQIILIIILLVALYYIWIESREFGL